MIKEKMHNVKKCIQIVDKCSRLSGSLITSTANECQPSNFTRHEARAKTKVTLFANVYRYPI